MVLPGKVKLDIMSGPCFESSDPAPSEAFLRVIALVKQASKARTLWLEVEQLASVSKPSDADAHARRICPSDDM